MKFLLRNANIIKISINPFLGRRRTFSEDSNKLIVKNDEVVGALKKSRKYNVNY